ncbi:MAG: hypothetical protein A2076_15805 [Geobacteraceae bacterium GWC2_53_11]|nr:MAG: hypothetical protein A2076_15805 [Geobacteraceae bacterium GWC2_53_11]
MAVAADIQQQVFDLLSRASNISFVTADQEGGGAGLLAPGQRVAAEVLSTLNNRVQVRIGTERFNLDLPMAVRTGQTLEMTFVSADPRSTFAIARQPGATPPVSLSDASRLLSLLISSEQISDPSLRASLQSIGTMLRGASDESAVLANLLDDALLYGSRQGEAASSSPAATKGAVGELAAGRVSAGQARPTADQARLATFETNAAQILKNIAQSSRFTLIEAANVPPAPLPLVAGEEVNATVVGTLPGGKAFVEIAGTRLELLLPQKAVAGEILRLTYLSSDPKPSFALSRTIPESAPPLLSEAGRWLSVLEHSEGGISRQQAYVLDQLNTVLKSLPHDSPAFSAIYDDARTYQRSTRQSPGTDSLPAASAQGLQQAFVTSGNGVVLSDDMAKLLQAVIKGNRLALLESLSQQTQPGSFLPGQQLKGEVLTALGGGRFMVQVGGQMLEFVMPKGIRRGDHINLFFIADEPRQTFLLARFGHPGAARVSDTGRWLSTLLGETAGQVPAQATLGLLRTLLSGPPTDAALLGRTLQEGLRESGLFYESHLARWFGGDFPLEDILKEPQGRLSPRLAQAAVPQEAPLADELVRASVKTGSAEIMEAVFKKVGSSMAHEGIADQRTLPVINQQLATLQNGQLVFRGDLFPGQHLEWSVAEREAGRDTSGKRERSWETSVSISLPNIGPVTASLSLDGTRIVVTVVAEESSAIPVLESGRVRLTEQLEGAGLTPAGMNFNHAGA